MPAYVSDVLLDPVKRAEHFEKHVTIDPVICVCHKTWVPSVEDLESQKCVCPFCGHNPHKMSSEYYKILYPITLNKSSLLYRSDSSCHLVDVTCRTCHKAIRVVIKSAIQRLKEGLPICWICDSRKGGRTGELFMYNYPELVDRIKSEVPEDDFFLAIMTEMKFEYDCGHTQSTKSKRFMKNHKRCDECSAKYREARRLEKEAAERVRPKRRRRRTREEIESGSVVYKIRVHFSTYKSLIDNTPKRVDAKCCKCNTVLNIQVVNFRKNIKRNKGQYVCNICASSKGIRLSEKLKSPEFAHVFWSEKNELSPNVITASSGRRVILECEKGHEWSPFAYAIGGCPRCAQSALVSKQEQGLVDFVCSLIGKSRVRTSVRDVIHPKELDVYVPSRGVAIEFNGTYWHSEENGKHKNYHYDKWLSCKDRDITLISVWEDDWLYRRSVVEHVLESTLLPNEHSSHSNHDAKPLSTQKITTPSVEILEFVKTYGLFEQQCLMDDASFFVTCSDDSGNLVSVSGVFEGPGFADVRSHVCIPGFEQSLSSVVSLLRADGIEVGILECNDYPLPARHVLEDVNLTQSRLTNPVRRCVLYAHNKYFRVSKCDIDDMDHVWNSGYTLWYA